MRSYQIYEFLVESELPLPAEPLSGAPTPGLELLLVRRLTAPLPVPAGLPPVTSVFDGQLTCFNAHEGLLICLEQSVQIHVDRGGQRIFTYAAPGAEPEAALYAVTMGITLCAALRGILCVHGAGVEIDGERIGLLAPSGTGKSSTAWALMQAGARFANDDVLLIRPGIRGEEALPAVSLYPKVNRELLTWAGLSEERCEPVLPGSQKLWFPLPLQRRATRPAPLAHLFILRPRPADDGDEVVVRRQRGLPALSELLRHSQAAGLAALLQTRHPELVPRCGAVLQTVPLSSVSYPKRFERLPALVEALRAALRTPAPVTR